MILHTNAEPYAGDKAFASAESYSALVLPRSWLSGVMAVRTDQGENVPPRGNKGHVFSLAHAANVSMQTLAWETKALNLTRGVTTTKLLPEGNKSCLQPGPVRNISRSWGTKNGLYWLTRLKDGDGDPNEAVACFGLFILGIC
ncbi:hypothetical protein HRR83_002046 [Exophiala dermatitidis]|uniref:Uncharacterized protein n=1 Tax=Exophiala dermatitidis TaxID=5970 RepID=A0AAN6EZZ0_EXODE|nr:hypothetical protein HRR74_002123 [Exophiala dermatitidis]KAJ4525800.1 hypothetical protein HRR73_002532 [Exophiala dermatitidis]KAJ4537129.1 hypothetical protein HRR76_005145 [Exophiala dermatitidis]KAJ4555273.1 hypothetical protein HRR77_001210 [Exophiala dermatitidis]KAJ4572412.1 hypothetical protein HRR79_003609 [Exophiala dermatitidis]